MFIVSGSSRHALIVPSHSAGTAEVPVILLEKLPPLGLLLILVIRHQAIELKLLGVPDPRGGSVRAVQPDSAVGRLVACGLSIGGAVVQVDKYVNKEEEEEGQAVENENVGNGIHGGLVNELHLLFGGTHEEEAGGIEKLEENQ